MTPLLWEILGSVIRAGATVLSGYLVSHHLLQAGDGEKFTSEFTTHVMLALPAIGALAWSIWQKHHKHSQLETALDTIAAMQVAQKRSPS